ncbi:MAG: hypothetical protein IJS60_08770 [Abditibacteriota bacterium]|nr:hypothetical protein [Abditibacteriota bacterium]
MFNDSKVKKIQDQVNNLEKDTEKKQMNNVVPDIKAKILGGVLDQNRKIYLYQWQAIDYNGVYDDMGGASNDAICIQELGQDMTNQSMSVQVNDIVSMQCDQNGYRFSKVGGVSFGDIETNLLDLINALFYQGQTYYTLSTENTTFGWHEGVKTINGIKQQGNSTAVVIRVLVGQKYDYTQDKNFEVFRDLYFDEKGILCKITQSEQKSGFETTQFPDA